MRDFFEIKESSHSLECCLQNDDVRYLQKIFYIDAPDTEENKPFDLLITSHPIIVTMNDDPRNDLENDRENDDENDQRHQTNGETLIITLSGLIYKAINNGAIRCLEFFHDFCVSFPKTTIRYFLSMNTNLLQTCQTIDKKQLSCLAYCYQMGCEWNTGDWITIFHILGFEGVKDFYESGFPWHSDFCEKMMKMDENKDKYRTLKYAHENNIPLPRCVLIDFMDKNSFCDIDNWLCWIYIKKHSPRTIFKIRGPIVHEIHNPLSRHRQDYIFRKNTERNFWAEFIAVKRRLRLFEKYVVRKLSMKRTTKRTHLIKYDLIEKSWHPDRFVNWCLDKDHKNNIQQSFA